MNVILGVFQQNLFSFILQLIQQFNNKVCELLQTERRKRFKDVCAKFFHTADFFKTYAVIR